MINKNNQDGFEVEEPTSYSILGISKIFLAV